MNLFKRRSAHNVSQDEQPDKDDFQVWNHYQDTFPFNKTYYLVIHIVFEHSDSECDGQCMSRLHRIQDHIWASIKRDILVQDTELCDNPYWRGVVESAIRQAISEEGYFKTLKFFFVSYFEERPKAGTTDNPDSGYMGWN